MYTKRKVRILTSTSSTPTVNQKGKPVHNFFTSGYRLTVSRPSTKTGLHKYIGLAFGRTNLLWTCHYGVASYKVYCSLKAIAILKFPLPSKPDLTRKDSIIPLLFLLVGQHLLHNHRINSLVKSSYSWRQTRGNYHPYETPSH